MKPQGLAFVPIGNIELNEDMEFASPPSTLRVLSVSLRKGGDEFLELLPEAMRCWRFSRLPCGDWPSGSLLRARKPLDQIARR